MRKLKMIILEWLLALVSEEAIGIDDFELADCVIVVRDYARGER